ncbi:MAG: PatB family C-S lyase [Bacteroidales bacterium]|jgi:cystathionine beta-lyase|nr:PatB family C-S lyase [Bacteroidales bacterium]
MYNFDEEINREGTDCIKYDGRQAFFGTADVLPLWVADMDFRTPDFVINALRKRLEHEILGYTIRTDAYRQAITGWLARRHGWTIKPEWISFSPGVVAGLTLAIEAMSAQDEEVVLQPPVYTPFFDSVRLTGRRIIENPLKIENGRYTFDFDDLKRKITRHTKLLLLCNPHNPGGMAWNREELTELVDICLKHNVFIISDEIHSDLILGARKHIPLPTLSEAAAANCAVLMAPSKTFNLAGLTTSFLVIRNKLQFKKYEKRLHTPHLHMGNLFGNIALESAYSHGEHWLEELLEYLRGNFYLLQSTLQQSAPGIVPMPPDATYLAWLDFSSFGLTDDELNTRLIQAGVGLNRGSQFGQQGTGYMRLNFGCTRATLKTALQRIADAFGG